MESYECYSDGAERCKGGINALMINNTLFNSKKKCIYLYNIRNIYFFLYVCVYIYTHTVELLLSRTIQKEISLSGDLNYRSKREIFLDSKISLFCVTLSRSLTNLHFSGILLPHPIIVDNETIFYRIVIRIKSEACRSYFLNK